ncbi:MAG: choice-of-anchor L domain-containing protein [Bacteroidota bacterium]
MVKYLTINIRKTAYREKTISLMYNIVSILLFFVFSNPLFSQLSVNTSMTPQQLVQNMLVGSGVTVSNVLYNAPYSYPGATIGSFTTGSSPTNLGMSSGIIMASGLVDGSDCVNFACNVGSPVTDFNSWATNTGSDTELQSLIPGYTVNDASVLEFDFIPLSDTIKFRYVFASEEYPEWVGSSFNDVFGFFVSGPNPVGGNYSNLNIALIPNTSLPVTIDNVNNVTPSYPQYYVDNQGQNGLTIVYDGFTTVLTAWCKVIPCLTYHIKLAVGDAGDSSYDSSVFLEANSFSSNAISVSQTFTSTLDTMAIEGCSDAIITFSLATSDTSGYTIYYNVSGTAASGSDYTPLPASVTIPAGQTSTSITISPNYDGLTEGIETVVLTVQTSVCGNTQVFTFYIRDNTQLMAFAGSDTSICAGGQATLNSFGLGGIPPYIYQWDNGAGNDSSVVVSPATQTTYVITVRDACGTTATADITVSIGNDNIDAGNDTTICLGDTASLVASGGISYQWSNGVNTAINPVSPVLTTVYYLTATNVCDGYDSVVVSVNPLPFIVASSSPDSICEGSTAILNASGGTSYFWSSNPADPSLSGQQTLASPVVAPSQSTVYTVTGTDIYTCANSASVTVNSYPAPIADFYATNTHGCVPHTVFFNDNSQNINFSTQYLWMFGDGNTSGLQNPSYTYIMDGVYTVTLILTDGSSCSDTVTYQQLVHVYPAPYADFAANPDVVSIFDPVIGFYDHTSGYPPPVQWQWSLGDGAMSSQQNFFYTYSDTGQFNVVLTVWNQYGCIDSVSNYILVQPDYTIYVPSGFTPNSDSYNDEFHVYGTGILAFNIKIFNRWGNMVYESDDMNAGWNGKTVDYKAPAGTYTWVLYYKDALKKEHTIYGKVNLLR